MRVLCFVVACPKSPGALFFEDELVDYFFASSTLGVSLCADGWPGEFVDQGVGSGGWGFMGLVIRDPWFKLGRWR